MACRDPLPEARCRDPRDRPRAGHDRRHRPGHRFGPRLPGLAVLLRPAHPAARRPQGLDRVDPPHRRRGHRRDDPRPWRSSPSATTATGGPSCGRRSGPSRSSGSRPGSGARRSASGTAASRSPPTWRARCCWSACSSIWRCVPGFPARIGGGGASQRFTLLAAFGAVATYALLLFGSQRDRDVDPALVFPDWPLMGGSLVPARSPTSTSAQVLHRYVAAVVGLIVLGHRHRGLAHAARPPGPRAAAPWAAVLYAIQIVVGGAPDPDHARRLGAGPAPDPRRRSSGRCSSGWPSRATTLRG